jgi:predicted DNA-binding antitoxin AbrB/MazE fold protein
MSQSFQAIFENGVLRPLTPLHLPESARVSGTIDESAAVETPGEPFDLKKQQAALDEMFREIQKLPQAPSNDGLSNRDHDQIIYGSIK